MAGKKSPKTKSVKNVPALTSEGREQQLINLAMNEAEKQLRNGTASSQMITHFLKLGAVKAELENEKLKEEIAFLRAKSESMESAKRSEELYSKAIEAFRKYSGQTDDRQDL